MHVYILVYVTDVHKVTLSSRVGERQAGIRADASPAGVLKIVILPLVPHASERRVSRKVCVSSQACLYSLHLQHVQWLTPWLETCKQNSQLADQPWDMPFTAGYGEQCMHTAKAINALCQDLCEPQRIKKQEEV